MRKQENQKEVEYVFEKEKQEDVQRIRKGELKNK
jgi:hypothetical protein